MHMKWFAFLAGLFLCALVFTVTASAESVLPCAFTRDLHLGISGVDVQCLQKYLNVTGILVSATGAGSPGNETVYFGARTKAAVAKWQAGEGISPTAGYFGSKSRARYAVRPLSPVTLPSPQTVVAPPSPLTETISPPSAAAVPNISYAVSVVSPAAGDIVRTGEKKEIRWTINPLPRADFTLNISLESLDGKRAFVITKSALAKSKSFLWDVPSLDTLPDRFVLVFRGNGIEARSNFFTIAAKDWIDLSNEQTRPKVIIPVKNTIWTHGTEYAIEWNGGGFSWGFDISVLLSDGSGVPTVIARNLPNTGIYWWRIPQDFPSGEYRIRASCTNCGVSDMYDDSDLFTITK